MKRLVSMILTTALVAGMFGVAMADNHMGCSCSSSMFKGAWTYRWISPDRMGPSMGTNWAETSEGQVVYFDGHRMIVRADGSGDLMTFHVFNQTCFTPSRAGVRVGSKVKVKSDDVSRARAVCVIPYYKWLAEQQK